MVWTLDMDDFNGEFCRKNKRQAIKKFPLVNAIKEELLIDEITTPISIQTTTTTLSNETIFLNDQFQNVLDQMFFDASSSSSSSSKFSQTYFFYLIFLPLAI
jgi:hypothetical protein